MFLGRVFELVGVKVTITAVRGWIIFVAHVTSQDLTNTVSRVFGQKLQKRVFEDKIASSEFDNSQMSIWVLLYIHKSVFVASADDNSYFIIFKLCYLVLFFVVVYIKPASTIETS